MKEIVIFGAGNYGRRALMTYLNEGEKIAFIVDNMSGKWGQKILNIPIIGPAEFVSIKDKYRLVVAVNVNCQHEIERQLQKMGIDNYEIFNLKVQSEKERLISYSDKKTLEDVLLYHVLKNEECIFYIDVGSNDPFEHSVTKLLYDMKNANGINIEPQRGYYNLTQKERPRDINLCLGVGRQNGKMNLYFQGGYSTVVQENVIDENCEYQEIDVVTLKDICDRYIKLEAVEDKCKREITFLKIDVEGAEYDVIVGADFEIYRPWIISVESTKPGTDIPNYDKWEAILLSNRYHFVMQIEENRYYVANEKSELDEKFCSISELKKVYNIYYAELLV